MKNSIKEFWKENKTRYLISLGIVLLIFIILSTDNYPIHIQPQINQSVEVLWSNIGSVGYWGK